MIRMLGLSLSLVLACGAFAEEPKKVTPKKDAPKPAAKMLEPGNQAPAFTIKDANGAEINLADLTAKGPVLVRLTCGCSGCDKELAYFQAMHDAYKDAGLTSVAIFKEPDAKVASYVK